MNLQNVPIPSNAVSALEKGNKVEAARIIRDEAWITLTQAGHAIDAYLEAHPEVKAKYLDHQGKAWSGLVYLIAFISAAAIIANLLR